MKCPTCGTEAIPDEAQFCPNCGQSTKLASRLEIRQEVQSNPGNVIGVQTEAIHGDIYGGDIYEVQIFAVSGQQGAGDWHRWLQQDRPPYKFLSPFSATDSAIFFGRATESEQVLRLIGEQRVVILYGPPGVGKTSLLAAGIIPRLMEFGALVVHIHDPLDPARSIRTALNALPDQFSISLPETSTFPELVQTLIDQTQGSLVLNFDQFERFFDPKVGERARTALLDDISICLETTQAEYLRLIFSLRDHAVGKIEGLRPWISEGMRFPYKLLPFDYQGAQEAIHGPLESLDFPVSYVGDLVNDVLIPDLDALNSDDPGRVSPEHLGVICHGLFSAAVDRKPPHIDIDLYRELKGAEGILTRHIQASIDSLFQEDRQAAQHILNLLATQTGGGWIPAAELELNGESPGTSSQLLNQLLQERLIVRRLIADQYEYSIPSYSLAGIIRRLSGPEIERRYRAEDELDRVWSAWLARDVLPGREQLRFLETTRYSTASSPAKSLLLLRGAITRDENPAYWLDQLRSKAGSQTILHLETNPNDFGPDPSSTAQSQFATLLSLGEAVPLPDGLDDVRPFGPVAWTAVTHAKASIRRTAALALAAADRYEAIDRLDWALQLAFSGRGRWSRTVELRGTLLDADEGFSQVIQDSSTAERFGIWAWRVWQRLIRERHRIGGLALGGAVGAGLGVAALRALIAILGPSSRAGIQFAIYFFWAAILGAALTLGLVAAEVFSLKGVENRISAGPEKASSKTPSPSILKLILGGLFFWLGHLLLIFFNALNPLSTALNPVRALLVILVGIAFALVLIDQPAFSLANGLRKWLLRGATGFRLVVAVLVVGLAEFAMLTFFEQTSLSIAWSAAFYRGEFLGLLGTYFPGFLSRFPQWSVVASLIDSVLLGLVFPVSVACGLHYAASLLARWRSINSQRIL